MIQNPTNKTQKLLQYLLLACMFSAGFFGYLMKSIDWFRAIPGDLVDARFNSIVLEHLLKWFQGRTHFLWSPEYFYPFENILAFSDNHLGSFWSYALARIAGLRREYAFLVWFVVGNVLNFWVCYFVFRKFKFSIIASAAGAFVFAFALPALPKEAHAQLVYRFACPLAFATFFDFLRKKRLSSFALCIFWLAVQFYCSIYLGVFLIYLLFALLLSTALIQYRVLLEGWNKIWFVKIRLSDIWAFILILLSFAAIFWLLYNYQKTSIQYGFKRTSAEIFTMMPTPSSYLIADRSWLTSWIGHLIQGPITMRHEMQMFFGLGVSVLAIFGIYFIWTDKHRNTIAPIALLSLFVLIVLTISILGHTLYSWILYLPGVNSIRAISRIVLVMLLPLSVVVASSFDRILNQVRYYRKKWLLIIFMFFLLVSETIFYQPYNTPILNWITRQDALIKLLPTSLSKDAILFVTSPLSNLESAIVEVDGVILAQDLDRPTLNGYSGNVPPGYLKPDSCLDFKNRLNSYLDFKPERIKESKDLLNRVVLISVEKCPNLPAIQTNRLFDSEIASHVLLNVSGVIVNQAIQITATIKNGTSEIISTFSKKGFLKLSWRIQQVGPDGRILNRSDFNARRDLFFTLEPGMSHKEKLQFNLPPSPGKYKIQISLVQEGVAWLHDLGMQIAEWDFEIK